MEKKLDAIAKGGVFLRFMNVLDFVLKIDNVLPDDM